VLDISAQGIMAASERAMNITDVNATAPGGS
jgi:hypothetical protein